MIEEGGVGASVGFIADEWGDPTEIEKKAYASGNDEPESIVRKWSWLELSFTCFPCNLTCRASVSKSFGNEMPDQIERLLSAGKISVKSAQLVGFNT